MEPALKHSWETFRTAMHDQRPPSFDGFTTALNDALKPHASSDSLSSIKSSSSSGSDSQVFTDYGLRRALNRTFDYDHDPTKKQVKDEKYLDHAEERDLHLARELDEAVVAFESIDEKRNLNTDPNEGDCLNTEWFEANNRVAKADCEYHAFIAECNDLREMPPVSRDDVQTWRTLKNKANRDLKAEYKNQTPAADAGPDSDKETIEKLEAQVKLLSDAFASSSDDANRLRSMHLQSVREKYEIKRHYADRVWQEVALQVRIEILRREVEYLRAQSYIQQEELFQLSQWQEEPPPPGPDPFQRQPGPRVTVYVPPEEEDYTMDADPEPGSNPDFDCIYCFRTDPHVHGGTQDDDYDVPLFNRTFKFAENFGGDGESGDTVVHRDLQGAHHQQFGQLPASKSLRSRDLLTRVGSIRDSKMQSTVGNAFVPATPQGQKPAQDKAREEGGESISTKSSDTVRQKGNKSLGGQSDAGKDESSKSVLHESDDVPKIAKGILPQFAAVSDRDCSWHPQGCQVLPPELQQALGKYCTADPQGLQKARSTMTLRSKGARGGSAEDGQVGKA